MKVYVHYCLYGFSNCYLLGAGKESSEDALKEAIIVDPGCMDEKILRFVEKNEYAIRGILITHDHANHVHGLRTLKKIYDAKVYAVNHVVCGHKTNLVRDGDVVNIGSFSIQVYSVPGHSSDSVAYKVGHLLFTGDALSAGLVGSTASSYGTTIQAGAIRSKLLSLPGDCAVLPGHGPPTTLGAERRFNVGLEKAAKADTKRSTLLRTLW